MAIAARSTSPNGPSASSTRRMLTRSSQTATTGMGSSATSDFAHQGLEQGGHPAQVGEAAAGGQLEGEKLPEIDGWKSSSITSSGTPAAYSRPMTEPMELVTTTSGYSPSSSSRRSTPRWANARAEPPERCRPTVGRRARTASRRSWTRA